MYIIPMSYIGIIVNSYYIYKYLMYSYATCTYLQLTCKVI